MPKFHRIATVQPSVIEDYISTQYAQLVNHEKPEWNGKKISVIGAGPAGITAAVNLAKLGVFCDADQLIICAGQLSKFNLSSRGESNDMRDHVSLAVDENCMTAFSGIFAGGDMTVGNLTAVHAVEDAKIASDGIHKFLSE